MATTTGPNGNVHYVEPNFVYDFTEKVSSDGNKHEQVPDLSDYCIALDMEVEISGRNSEISQEGSAKRTIILSWKQDRNGSSVGFLEGTKIYKDINKRPSLDDLKNKTNLGKIHEDYINSLTTNYTDIFYTDLKDYGTTEMFGIESVDVQYNNYMVPEITIKFVDIRGVSLFSPTEMRYETGVEGIKGMSKNDIASSFFQCFFTFPYPRFSIMIKGFYGNPVCYEVTCSDFRASFVAETGNFEATAKFVGYSFSFLNDVSLNALLAAPFAKPIGAAYWEERAKDGGSFVIKNNKGGSTAMPTLVDIVANIASVMDKANKIAADDPAVKEMQNANKNKEDIKELQDIYASWFDSVKAPHVNQHNENLRYKAISRNGSNCGFIILLPKNVASPINLYNASQQGKLDECYRAITNWSEKHKDYKLAMPSKISDLGPRHIFRIKNGVVLDDRFKEEQFVIDVANDWLKEINAPDKKKETESFLANFKRDDGTIWGFVIKKDTSFWNRELDRLENTSENLKDEVKTAQDQAVTEALGFSPSIENITRIIFAHFETLMHMMFQTSVDIQKQHRTPDSLGVSNADLSDVSPTEKEVPPFPRVVINTTTSQGVTKKEDAWVGSFKGSTKFLEEDLVNSLFDAIDEFATKFKQADENASGGTDGVNTEEVGRAVMEIPLTPFDLFIPKNPYGSDKKVSLSLSSFAANVCSRMMAIMDLSAFSRGSYMPKYQTDAASTLGEAEAINFATFFPTINPKLIKCLTGGEDNKALTPEVLLNIVTNKNDEATKAYKEGVHWPWDAKSDKDTALFSEKNGVLYYNKFKSGKFTAYPIIMSVEEMASTQDGSYDNGAAYSYFGGTISQNNDPYAYHIFKNWKVVKSIIDTQVKGHISDVGGLKNYMVTFNNFYYNPNGDYGYRNLLHFEEAVGGIPCVLRPKMTTVLFKGKIGEKDQVAGSAFMPNTKEKFKKAQGIFDGRVSLFEAANKGTVIRLGKYQIGSWFNESYFKELLGTPETGPQTGNYVFTEFLGFDQDFKITGKKSLFGQVAYYSLRSENLKAFMFLKSISTSINLGKCKQYYTNHSVVVVPRLFVLLLGGVVTAKRNPNDFKYNGHNVRDGLSDLYALVENELSPMAQNQYQSEFNSFVNGSWKNIKAAYELGSKKEVEFLGKLPPIINDGLFYNLKDNFFQNYMSASIGESGGLRLANREDSKIMSSLVAEMLTPTICAMGTIFGKSLTLNNVYPKQDVSLSKSIATTYLESFLKKLSELLTGGGNQEGGNDDGQGVSISNDPQATTEDMKVGLYGYLKILYDKWVPSTTESEWKMEEFFKIDNGDRGHTIHFIDSYYNVIGQDIYIDIGNLVNGIRNNFQYNNNVWSSMLMFMSDIYASTQCLFLSIQNFIDLNDINNMKSMFNLVPYNNITDVKRHPDFVVMYPYQPSENLDNGSSFENDGFMLNRSDELANLPEALTSRSDNTGVQGFYLPAFGVAYGKQYQSMFSNIDVGMESPMVTEQSLKAKMVIAMQGAGEDKSGNSKNVVTAGQDLYSIYASNSYTCTVTMMGCAWVQPLMYFVLLNIPMFRGSYLIEKVSHHLEPGNMTTTFVGVRMANVSTRALKNPLYVTDSNNNGSYSDDLEAMQFKAADLDNDCPFETFSPYGGDGLGPSYASFLDKKIYNAPDVGPVTAREMNRSGFTTVLDALTFGCLHEMYIYRDELAIALEATVIYNWVCYEKNWKSLFSDAKAYRNRFVIAGCANGIYPPYLDSVPNPKKDKDKFEKFKKVVQDVFTNSPSCILNKYGKATPNGSPITLDTLTKIYQTELTKASENKSGFHGDVILTYTNKNYSETVKFRNTNGACWKPKANNGSEKKNKSADFVKGLTEAIQNTMNSNDHLKVDLAFKINGMDFIITQKDGKTDKLAKVFDVLVRGYFDQYIQKISWRGADKDNPSSIGVTASEKPRNDKERQEIYKADNSGKRYNCQPDGTIWGTNAYKTFIKKFGRDEVLKGGGIFAKTVPQCAKANGNTVLQDKTHISGITVTSCAELVTIGNTSGVGGKLQATMPIGDGKFDAGKAANFLIQHGLKESEHICAFAVQQAIRAGGVIAQNGSGYECALNQRQSGFKLLQSGYTTESSYKTYMSHPNVGDIMGMTKGSDTKYVGHICMYCGDGNGWISDFKQSDAYVYKDSGKGKYWILQYAGGGKSSGGKIQGLCHNGVCLKK